MNIEGDCDVLWKFEDCRLMKDCGEGEQQTSISTRADCVNA